MNKPILIQIIEQRLIHMRNQKAKGEETRYALGYIDALKFVLAKYETWKGDTN